MRRLPSLVLFSHVFSQIHVKASFLFLFTSSGREFIITTFRVSTDCLISENQYNTQFQCIKIELKTTNLNASLRGIISINFHSCVACAWRLKQFFKRHISLPSSAASPFCYRSQTCQNPLSYAGSGVRLTRSHELKLIVFS